MRGERGFAIVASVLLVALSFFFGVGTLVFCEHARTIESAVRAQQLQTMRLREELAVTEGAGGLLVVNRGTVPSIAVSLVIRRADNSLAARTLSPPVLIGVGESRTIQNPTGGRAGVATYLGNVFWAEENA